MPDPASRESVPIPPGKADELISMAARAPSILNTQPWRFRVGTHDIELYADPARRLRADTRGREMLISCGAALYGLRLAIRSTGYQPVVQLLPEPGRHTLLARVSLGGRMPLAAAERKLIEALPHRYTHRGPFAPVPLPAGLLIGLQHDAVAEHAGLELIDRPAAYTQLANLVAQEVRRSRSDAQALADTRQWVRLPGSAARDGVPASAIARQGRAEPGRLTQRDLDLGRDIGLLQPGGPPAATAVLLTSADTHQDWLRAGQALHRLLAHAASSWVFANLYSQPLESPSARALIRSRLGLPGAPQLILQFGRTAAIRATARRPPGEVTQH